VFSLSPASLRALFGKIITTDLDAPKAKGMICEGSKVLHDNRMSDSGLFFRFNNLKGQSISRLQQHDLKRMVEMEDYDMLRDMGTDELIRILSSDIKQGITTTKRDIEVHSGLQADIAEASDVRVLSLAERRCAYGENEARAWDIRQSIYEAWRPVASIRFSRTM
jgi:hypothetical protein